MNDLINKLLGKNETGPKMGSTQEHLPILDVKNDTVILKDGSIAMVLQTSAVNFDLLSENEQLAIISSFAGMLNSLSFPIQIVIRSKRLDISEYVKNLTKIEQNQPNELLKKLTQQYRTFIETLTLENEVLDKQFYVVLSVSAIELGIVNDPYKNFQKAITILSPRRDHIIKQLARIGLKATSLDNEHLVRLFYDFYNETQQEQEIRSFVDVALNRQNLSEMPKQENTPETSVPLTPTNSATPQSVFNSTSSIPFNQPQGAATNATPSQPLTEAQRVEDRKNLRSAWLQNAIGGEPAKETAPTQPAVLPQIARAATAPAPEGYPNAIPQQRTNNSPFIVEELGEDYGTV